MSPVVLTSALLAAAPGGAAAEAVPLPALVKKVLDAYGGERALKGVVAVRESGKVASTMRGGTQGPMVRTFARPDRLRVEIGYPGEDREVRVLAGSKGWRRGAPVAGPPLAAMVLQAARLSLPLLLAERLDQLKDLGVVESSGQRLRAVEVPVGEGLTVTALVDPSTWHVVESVGRLASPAGALEFRSAYRDFRKVKGVLAAYGERTWAMGQHTGDTTLDLVEHLAAVPAEAFAP